MTRKERIGRASQIFRYMDRNGLREDNLSSNDLCTISDIVLGQYTDPLLTPNEVAKIIETLLNNQSRSKSVYSTGSLVFILLDYRNQPIKFKRDYFDSAWFPDLNFGIKYSRVKIKDNQGCAYSYRWVWKGDVDETALMMLWMKLPPEIINSLRKKLTGTNY